MSIHAAEGPAPLVARRALNRSGSLACALLALALGGVSPEAEAQTAPDPDMQAASRLDNEDGAETRTDDPESEDEAQPDTEVTRDEPDEDDDDRPGLQKLNPLTWHWENGLHISGKWDHLHMKIAGDLQNDTAGFVNTESAEGSLGGEINGGVEWRRARVYAEGRLTRHLDFQFRYDFTAGNPPNLKDAYGSLVNLPIPTLEITAGRFKAPLGLDGYTGAADLVFMERSLMSWAFLPSRNTGIMAHGDSPEHRFRWSIAALQPEAESLDLSATDNLGWSARLAYAFAKGKKKENLVHIGADFWRRNVSDTIQYGTAPESNLAPFFVDTGEIPAESANITVLESAFQRGKWTVQGEFTLAQVNPPDRDSLYFHGFYVQGSYFLTGEKMAYRNDRGTFTRPYPKRNIRQGGGGAVELGFRYSRINLTDGPVDGGVLADWTVGLNWYPTYHLKVMFNGIVANLKDANPVGILQMRLQVAF